MCWYGRQNTQEQARGAFLNTCWSLSRRWGDYLVSMARKFITWISTSRTMTPSNLLVVTASEHQKYHPHGRNWVTMTCEECGKTFEVKPSRAHPKDPTNQRKYCSLECRYKAWGRKMHPGMAR